MAANLSALWHAAPITDKAGTDRQMRTAVNRAGRGKSAAEFAQQQQFDRALASLVAAIPVGPDVAEWFANENLIPVKRRSWIRILFNPVVVAIVLAIGVIAGVFAIRVHEKITDFPGANKARKLLTVASSTRSVLLDPMKTTAGTLGDLFFMKHRLEHYDVPPQFADFKTLGCRVFDDDEAHRVAQIWVVEKKMQFFLFPAEDDPKGGKTPDFSAWRFVEQEGWSGVVQQRNGVCFMAAIRGSEKDLQPYLSQTPH